MARSVRSSLSASSNSDADHWKKGKKKGTAVDIQLLNVLSASKLLHSSTLEGTGDTSSPQEERTSSEGCPLTNVMSSQQMAHTDSSAAFMRSKVEIIQKHKNLPVPPSDMPPEEYDEYEEEEERYPLQYPPETQTRIMEWLECMPSSPSSVTSDLECSSSILAKQVGSQESLEASSLMMSPSSIQRRMPKKTIRDKVIDNEPIKFSSTPTPVRSYEERSALLDTAEARFQEWDRNRVLDKQGYVKPVVVKGTAKWYKCTNKRKNKGQRKRSWLNPRRFLMWLTNLGFVQWFMKKKTEEALSHQSCAESYHDDLNNMNNNNNQNGLENSLPEDDAHDASTANFIPFEELTTATGNELPTTQVFGGEPLEDQVKAAVATIAAKIRPQGSYPGEQSKRSQAHVGGSDAEEAAAVLNRNDNRRVPDQVDSTEEVKRLTELLKSRSRARSKPNSPKMHSIFAVHNEHVQATRTVVVDANIQEDTRGRSEGASRNGFQYLLSRITQRWHRNHDPEFEGMIRGGVHQIRQRRLTFHRRNHQRIHPYVLIPEEATLLHNNNYAVRGNPVNRAFRQEPEEEAPIRSFVTRTIQGFMRFLRMRPQAQDVPDQNLVLPGEEVIRDEFQIFDHPRRNDGVILRRNANSASNSLTYSALREQIMASQREFITRSPRRPGLMREEFPEGYTQSPSSERNRFESSPKPETNKKSTPST